MGGQADGRLEQAKQNREMMKRMIRVKTNTTPEERQTEKTETEKR